MVEAGCAANVNVVAVVIGVVGRYTGCKRRTATIFSDTRYHATAATSATVSRMFHTNEWHTKPI